MKKIMSVVKGTQCYYNVFCESSEKPKGCLKWENKLQDRDIDWKKIFMSQKK